MGYGGSEKVVVVDTTEITLRLELLFAVTVPESLFSSFDGVLALANSRKYPSLVDSLAKTEQAKVCSKQEECLSSSSPFIHLQSNTFALILKDEQPMILLGEAIPEEILVSAKWAPVYQDEFWVGDEETAATVIDM